MSSSYGIAPHFTLDLISTKLRSGLTCFSCVAQDVSLIALTRSQRIEVFPQKMRSLHVIHVYYSSQQHVQVHERCAYKAKNTGQEVWYRRTISGTH